VVVPEGADSTRARNEDADDLDDDAEENRRRQLDRLTKWMREHPEVTMDEFREPAQLLGEAAP
jgi:hypothetical protein